MPRPSHRPPVLRLDRLPFLAMVGALTGAWLALTPSLLPRTAVFQGALCAVAAIMGYGVGALLGWILRAAGLRLTGTVRRRVWIALLSIAVAGTVLMLILAHGWQQVQRSSLGMEPGISASSLIIVLVSSAVFAVLLIVCRSILTLIHWVRRRLSRRLPAQAAAWVAVIAVAASVFWFGRELVVGTGAAALDRAYLAVNDEFTTDEAPPTVSEVSGGPGSSESWESLGRQGRIFIANTPTIDAITEFTNTRSSPLPPEGAKQPIRVYVGGGAIGEIDLQAEAERAVAELERTGGFNRAVLNVVTGTGRGWVNENQASGLEYLWAGDTATVSMQYSYLPSWMSYLVDEHRAREAGRLLFDAVYARWQELPKTERPRLVVSGESLGSYGSEGAFSGAQDLVARTDGALWVGPTANNLLWQQFTAERAPGSPVFLPDFDDGESVRFSSDGTSWEGSGRWAAPRIGYLQHANDPVTWLDFSIAFERPAWLSDSAERGPGVPESMVWVPLITVLQLGVDQLASGVPAGQGHEFGQAPAVAWATILPPDGWQSEDTTRLVTELAARELESLGSSQSSDEIDRRSNDAGTE